MEIYRSAMKRVLRHLGFWGLYVVFTVTIYYVQEPNLGLHITYELASLPAKFFGVYATLYLILPKFLLKRKYSQAAFLQLLVLLIGMFMLRILVLKLVYPIYFPEVLSNFWPDDLSKFISPLLDLIVVTSVAVVIKLLKHREQEELDRLEREKFNVQNELQLLKSQLQPHFLFNTLNGLYAQTLKTPETAAKMILKLSDLLRFVIYEGRKSLVPLEEDIKCIKSYMALEHMRFNSRLQVNFSLSGGVANKMIPPLLLLPFVENAFKHGVSSNNNINEMSCKITVSEINLVMDLENSYLPPAAETVKSKGIGLLNVKRRLSYLYGDQYELNIHPDGNSYRVTLKIPLASS